MTIDLGTFISISISVLTIILALGGFFLARLKDAEERGAQKQRILNLEKRSDAFDEFIKDITEKLEGISSGVNELLTEHRLFFKGEDRRKHPVNRRECPGEVTNE